ncbi:hypothetical protein SETIT_1G052300v2 [Setaria italica]|uniref:Uncharacterized protein n=2 Tax=Setaria TaxID=4554 RepID=A0A368PH06_SETIT|nr:hypothetical protein SETIT_1G052300v2 [Setaria italica]TKW37515.1 hypothetical protein SEVIR_1G051500v2 [Setaria viridis]
MPLHCFHRVCSVSSLWFAFGGCSSFSIIFGHLSFSQYCLPGDSVSGAGLPALLPLVALRGLVPIPRLLHLILPRSTVALHGGSWPTLLRTSVGIVANLATLETSGAHWIIRSRWSAGRSHLAILREAGRGVCIPGC